MRQSRATLVRIKVSFSCMPNMVNIIKEHNTKILGQTSPTAATGQDRLCNCRDTANCSLGRRYQVSSIVYKVTVATEDGNQAMNYFGLCEGTFKKTVLEPPLQLPARTVPVFHRTLQACVETGGERDGLSRRSGPHTKCIEPVM